MLLWSLCVAYAKVIIMNEKLYMDMLVERFGNEETFHV